MALPNFGIRPLFPVFPFIFPPRPPQIITVVGAGNTTPIVTTVDVTLINNSPIGAVSSTHTMENGRFIGQVKTVRLDGNGSTVTSTITPIILAGGTSVTLTVDSNAHSAGVTFMWNVTSWTVVDIFNGTINP